MSREFHWVAGGAYLHSVLDAVESDRPVTGEPVADAIRELLIALAPIEYAVASHQACDSTEDRVVITCHRSGKAALAALDGLRRAILRNDALVESIVRQAPTLRREEP